MDTNADQVQAVTKLQPTFDLNELMSYFESITNAQDPNDASDFMMYFLLKVYEELDLPFNEDIETK
jgi:hypothetical protein